MRENQDDGDSVLHSEDVTWVWVIDENIMAEVVTLAAHYAVVRFVKNGLHFEVMLEPDEFLFMDDNTGEEWPLGCGGVGGFDD